MSAVCQPWNGRMSAVYQPYVSRMSAVCPPYIRRMSAIPNLPICLNFKVRRFFEYTALHFHDICVDRSRSERPGLVFKSRVTNCVTHHRTVSALQRDVHVTIIITLNILPQKVGKSAESTAAYVVSAVWLKGKG